MIVSIVGPPLAGKHKLGRALAAAANLAFVDFDSVKQAIASRQGPLARRAAARVERGVPVPDELLGSVVRECLRDRDAVLVGYPGSERQLHGMEAHGGMFVHSCILLEASRELIDARRAARGLSAVEQDHPGALARIASELAPVLARAEARQLLLRLDASRPTEELLMTAAAFLHECRSDGRGSAPSHLRGQVPPDRRSYLLRVASIRWSGFETAYGSARLVPWWLVNFRFAPSPCAVRAGYKLWISLCHQHAYVSSAALPAAPFIIEVLTRQQPPVVEEALDIMLGFLRCTEPGVASSASWHSELRRVVLGAVPIVERLVKRAPREVADMAKLFLSEADGATA